MGNILQEFFMYNLIEFSYVCLAFIALAQKKLKITEIIIYTFIFALINMLIKIILPYPIIIPVGTAICISLFFALVFKDSKILNCFKYVFIIIFCIMMVSEMSFYFMYTFIFHIDISKIDNFIIRWFYFIPVYIMDYVIYFAILRKRRWKIWEQQP